jgi:hypothetical protein
MRPPGNLSADLHGHVLAYVADVDRGWFEHHPTQTSYSRPAFEHEFCDPRQLPACTPPVPVVPPEPGHRWEMLVQVDLIGPGLRTRQPFWVLVEVGE